MSQQESNTPPELKLAIDVQTEVTVVRCSGRLTIENEKILRTEVRKLITPGARVVLDLTDVTYCDSSGIGAVISLYVSSKACGCKLELINLGEKVRRLFSMANILWLFENAADITIRIP